MKGEKWEILRFSRRCACTWGNVVAEHRGTGSTELPGAEHGRDSLCWSPAKSCFCAGWEEGVAFCAFYSG